MLHLANLFEILIILVGFFGIGLTARRLAPRIDLGFWICAAPILLVVVLFCLEYFVGLGQPQWLWIPGCAFSLYLLNQERKTFFREPAVIFFLFGFLFCLFWRYTSPDITINTEALGDLAHVISCSSGTQLPPEDIWMKGYKDNAYYIMQYYGAGFVHRWTPASTGEAFNYSFCLLVGIALAGIGTGVRNMTGSMRAGWLAVVAVAMGGAGSTLLLPIMSGWSPDPWAAMRFIGCFARPHDGVSPLGLWMIKVMGESPIEAPMEYYSFIMTWRDYHASLSSLLFFGLGVLCLGTAERAQPQSPTDKACVAGAIAGPILLLVSNTWICVLQGGLVFCWLVYRHRCGRKDDLRFLLACALGATALIYPSFVQMAHSHLNGLARIEWAQQRPPFLNWLAVMFPGCAMWLVVMGGIRKSRLARFVAVVGLGAMLFTFLFYVHDPYGGGVWGFFNTSLKWWPWVYAFLFVYGIAATWNHPRMRWGAIIVVLVTVGGTLNWYRCWWETQHTEHMGQMAGDAWFREDEAQAALLNLMKTLPKGVVLESLPPDSGGPCLAVAEFSGHLALGGWIASEEEWRGDNLQDLYRARDDFYKGTLAEPRAWLAGIVPGGVDYIVFLARDNRGVENNWAQTNAQIAEDYDWRGVWQVGVTRVGVWVRKKSVGTN